jgi:hypothetical protein
MSSAGVRAGAKQNGSRCPVPNATSGVKDLRKCIVDSERMEIKMERDLGPSPFPERSQGDVPFSFAEEAWSLFGLLQTGVPDRCRVQAVVANHTALVHEKVTCTGRWTLGVSVSRKQHVGG